MHLKNIYSIIGALTFDTKIILVSILSHVLVVIMYYVSFESLKPQNSSCVNRFEIRHCITFEMVLKNLLGVSSPLVGGVIFQMYYSLIESKLLII